MIDTEYGPWLQHCKVGEVNVKFMVTDYALSYSSTSLVEV